MAFTVIPTNIGGVSLNSLANPLASLLNGTPSAQVMTYPSDLGSNPAMGHAVIFQAYDYKTGLGNSAANFVNQLGTEISNAISGENTSLPSKESFLNNVLSGLKEVANLGLKSLTASQYTPLTQGAPLATINLFMPEELQVEYIADWNKVSLTKELGLPGIFATAYSDIKANGLKKDVIAPYAIKAASSIASGVLGQGAALAAQAAGIAMTNPQTQLLFQGTDLREFTLQFILTPKTSSEAQTVKNICDSFAYFSLPGLSGSQVGGSGQYFTPPQVFKVQFQFLGETGITNTISNAIYSALNSTGLNVLTNALGNGGSSLITGGSPAKTFTIKDCVLLGVGVDYTPNGWATYQDGYPVQTVLSLRFRELTVFTKEDVNNTAVKNNYSSAQFTNSIVNNISPSNGPIVGTGDFSTGISSNGTGIG
jgi:Tail-tube assembly protein